MSLFFIGGYAILYGISFLHEMMLWRMTIREECLWYYIKFAFIDAPVFYVGVFGGLCLVLAGIILIIMALGYTKKCSLCGKRILTKHNYCCSCGTELK